MLYTESKNVFQFSQRHDSRRIGLRILRQFVQAVDDVIALDFDSTGFANSKFREEGCLLFVNRRPHCGTVEDGRGHGLGEFVASPLGCLNLISLIVGYE